jgi:hypothetical protein
VQQENACIYVLLILLASPHPVLALHRLQTLGETNFRKLEINLRARLMKIVYLCSLSIFYK